MPPRKKRSPRKASIRDAVTKPLAAASAKAVSVKPKAKKKPGAWKMPPPLPAGEVFTDNAKKKWVLGGSIGKGGFGEIYLASKQGSSGDSSKENYVIKIVSSQPMREPMINVSIACSRNLMKMVHFSLKYHFTQEQQKKKKVCFYASRVYR